MVHHTVRNGVIEDARQETSVQASGDTHGTGDRGGGQEVPEVDFWPSGPLVLWPEEVRELYFAWLLCEWEGEVQ